MQYVEYILQKKIQFFPGTFKLQLKPKHTLLPMFMPGQYAYLRNPYYLFQEKHPFSIASSPLTNDCVEFCIKVVGDWTEKITELPEEARLYVSYPLGSFVWEENIKHSFFLLGGIGISPIMSMLRTFAQNQKNISPITMLYGSRTPETVAYKNELQELANILPLRVIMIYSHLSGNHPWQGYRGFITKDIIKNETLLTDDSTFFIVGPPIFIEKMKSILSNFSINPKKIIEEKLDIPR